MKTVKVNVSLDLELPFDEKDEVYQYDAKGLIHQTVFDGFTNYAICRHLSDAVKWLCKSKENKKSTEWSIYKHHDDWAKILEKAVNKAKITIEND